MEAEMRATVATFVGLVALAAVSVQAAPISIKPTEVSLGSAPLIELVAQGCGGVGAVPVARPVGILALGTLGAELALTALPRWRLPRSTQPIGAITSKSRSASPEAKIGAGPDMCSRLARLFWVAIDRADHAVMIARCRLVDLIYGPEPPIPADEKRQADYERLKASSEFWC
jgi:hypothetical protein